MREQELGAAFGARLRAARRACGLTQQMLARRIGYSEKAVSKWECGVLAPTSAVVRLAEALGVTPDELLCFDGSIGYLLGIDGGATKTELLLTDREGRPIERCTLGACNPVDLGFEAACAVLAEGIRRVCRDVPPRRIALFAGISGGGSGENPARLHAFLSSFGFAVVENGSDALNIVEGGLGDADGIAVIAGTGSIAYVKRGGELRRIGGYGYLFDNGGNGYSLGRGALRAALRAEDGSGEATALHALVCERLGAASVLGQIPALYELGKRGIAAFAPLVIAAAREGDAVALRLLDAQMRELSELLLVGRRALGTPTVRAVLVGGLMQEAELLLPLLHRHLGPEAEGLSIEVHTAPPVLGAVRLAAKAAEAREGEGRC